MFKWLLLAFFVIPLAELFLIIASWQAFGLGITVLWLVIDSIIGAWLVKREGFGVWRRAQEKLAAAEMPSDDIMDGGLILVAGGMMLTPGFLTDIVGFALLIPPLRAPLRNRLKKRYATRITTRTTTGSGFSATFGGFGPGFDAQGFGGAGFGVHGDGPRRHADIEAESWEEPIDGDRRIG